VGDLSLDTAVEEPSAADTASHGRARGGDTRHYRAMLSEDWDIWGPNGGYLAAIALRAAGRSAAIARPVALSAHFLRVARFEAVDLYVTTLHAGRRAESIQVAMEQDGRPVLAALVRTAAEGAGLAHDVTQCPDVPRPDDLKTFAELYAGEGGPPYKFWQNFDAKPVDPRPMTSPPLPGPPRARQWHRFAPRATFDDPFLEAARSLILLDTMGWPAATRLHTSPAFLAPSLDVVAWFHRLVPDEPWLLSDHECPLGDRGLLGMHGRIWTRDGRLVASGGAQLLCVPAPAA
jgi:acyl-CoA thioesterase-2